MKVEEYKVRIETDNTGSKKWYKDGKLHRDGDLPAVEYNDGTKEWWKDGEQYNHKEVIKEMNVSDICKTLGYKVKIIEG